MNLKNITIIPARMGSSRLPGKPLKSILGISMLEHIYQRIKLSKHSGEIYIATCDIEIVEAVSSFGGKAIMTSANHERCTDRTAEAVQKIEAKNNSRFDIVTMVQGDEPLIRPEMVDAAIQAMENPSTKVVNLATDIDLCSHSDKNEVKLVTDLQMNALYFSREAIPSLWKGNPGKTPVLKQVCIIPFKRDALQIYCSLPQSPLEILESVDMLRFLENQIPVKIVKTNYPVYSVDTPQDLERVIKIMASDELFLKYRKNE